MYAFSLESKTGCLSHPELALGGGCCNSSLVTDCSVSSVDFFSFSSYCYCDEACYYFDNCCDDILEIGCFGKLPKAHPCLHMCTFNMSYSAFNESHLEGTVMTIILHQLINDSQILMHDMHNEVMTIG